MVSHPFDLIKVRMQAAHQSQSALHTIKAAITGPQGLLGLYRGVLPVLTGTPVRLLAKALLYGRL